MAKKKDAGMVAISINIEKNQLDWLNKNHYNLNRLTRAYMNEFISTMEKTRTVAVPAWIKAADTKAIKARLRKNPKLRRIIEDE